MYFLFETAINIWSYLYTFLYGIHAGFVVTYPIDPLHKLLSLTYCV